MAFRRPSTVRFLDPRLQLTHSACHHHGAGSIDALSIPDGRYQSVRHEMGPLYGDDTHPRGALAAALRTFPAIPVLPCDVSLRHPMGFCGLTRERWARTVGGRGVVCLLCQEIESAARDV